MTGGRLDCGLRRNDGEAGMVVGAGTHPLAPSPTFGEGEWIPAFAGRAGPGAWIAAFAGMTGGWAR